MASTLRIAVLIPFMVTCLFQKSLSQPKDSVASSCGLWSRNTLSYAATGAIAGGTLLYSWGVWWKNDFRSFRFYTEAMPFFEANLAVDKVGHTFTSYYLFHATNDILLWGDHDEETAFWWASGLSAGHALAVEIGDGFSQYGFDVEDLAANWIGVGYCILQKKVPVFQNFEMKWSLYYPLNRHSFKLNALYDYHIYWLSARVNELLPASVEPLWPDWLQLAFGYSSADRVTRREFVVSFDYNLEKIPVEGKDVNLLKKLVNMFHLPAPGVKFSPGHKPVFQLLLLQ